MLQQKQLSPSRFSSWHAEPAALMGSTTKPFCFFKAILPGGAPPGTAARWDGSASQRGAAGHTTARCKPHAAPVPRDLLPPVARVKEVQHGSCWAQPPAPARLGSLGHLSCSSRHAALTLSCKAVPCKQANLIIHFKIALRAVSQPSCDKVRL